MLAYTVLAESNGQQDQVAQVPGDSGSDRGGPAPYLNAIYLCAMFVQNGSAIFVAVLAEQRFAELRVAGLSFVFTIAYFVVVEAMSKTFGILHRASVALALTPVVWAPGRALRVRPGC